MFDFIFWLFNTFGYFAYIVFYLLFTLIVELFVLLFMKNKKVLFRPLLIANVITNPILNLILPGTYLIFRYCFSFSFKITFYYFDLASILATLLLEILVVFSEAYIFKFFTNLKYKKCLKYSFIFNLTSFIAGLLLPVLIILIEILSYYI
jgi:hypothetical protein